MRSIPLAMTWEVFYRGRWAAIMATLWAVLFPSFVYGLLAMKFDFQPNSADIQSMHFVFSLINIGLLVMFAIDMQNALTKLAPFPISVRDWLIWRTLPSLMIIAGQMVVLTTLLNTCFHLEWPLWGPLLFALTSACLAFAVMWATENSLGIRVLAGLLLFGLLGVWFKMRFGDLYDFPKRRWVTITAGEIATMLAAVGASYLLARWAIARNRRGDAISEFGLKALWDRYVKFEGRAESRPFSSSSAALFWLIWQSKARVPPIICTSCLVLLFAGYLLFERHYSVRSIVETMSVSVLVPVLAAFIGMVLIGNVGPNDTRLEMAQFLASRPLSTSAMAKTFLQVEARSLLTCWVAWLAAMGLISGVLLLCGLGDRYASELLAEVKLIPNRWLPVLLAIPGSWALLSVGSSLLMWNFSSRVNVLIQSVFFGLIGLSVVPQVVLSEHLARFVFQAMLSGLGIAMGVWTVWAFREAMRQKFLGSGETLWAWSSWTVMCVIAISITGLIQPISWRVVPFLIFVIGGLSLSIAPLASTPLALSSNRHR